MPKLYVHTPFTLRHDDGTLESFTEGERDINAATAAHWYVKHHTRAPGDAPKPDAAPVDGAELAAARAALDAQAEQLAAAREEVSAEAGRLAALRAELDDLTTKLDIQGAALDTRESAIAAREQEHEARVAASDVAQKAPADTGARSGKRA